MAKGVAGGGLVANECSGGEDEEGGGGGSAGRTMEGFNMGLKLSFELLHRPVFQAAATGQLVVHHWLRGWYSA